MIRITAKLLTGKQLMVTECSGWITNGQWVIRASYADTSRLAEKHWIRDRTPPISQILDDLRNLVAFEPTVLLQEIDVGDSVQPCRIWREVGGARPVFVQNRFSPLWAELYGWQEKEGPLVLACTTETAPSLEQIVALIMPVQGDLACRWL